jgi:DNA-binding response OmpR family regulator
MAQSELNEPAPQPPAGAPHILVVDDDPGIQTLLGRYLREQGFMVRVVGSGSELDAALLADSKVDLLVLDIMLPGEDGLSIARRLNPKTRPPVIMLSARGEDIDRIVGLEVGADDYLPKPFNPRELVARIKAVLRRQSSAGNPGSPTQAVEPAPALPVIGDFALNTQTHQAFLQGQPLDLTHGEWRLLQFFLERPNRVINRDQIMDYLKGYERAAFDRSIDVRITRLRRKIEATPTEPRYLVTIWGEGYLFAPSGRSTRSGDTAPE